LSACAACLRRSALLALLAPWIARALAEHRRIPALLALSEDELIEAACGRKRATVDAAIECFDPAAAGEEASRAGLGSVCRHADGFPARLLTAADAPRALYLLGDRAVLEDLDGGVPVAIVGARRASPYGVEAARALARELAACGVPIVSGMALGVDSAAHEGALEGGGPTIAVLAGSAGFAYPRSKRHLHRRIAGTGLVISEMPPGFRPFRWCFPARNRIMAGLAAMTVVVEGTSGSGSLITARFAQDLGREVGAVPGQVTSALATGPNDLLADGACVVRSAADVLDALYGAGAGDVRLRAATKRPPELEPRLLRVLEAVERGLGTADAIAGDPDEAGDVLAALSELELIGLLRRSEAGCYVRTL
jgi:DNA processing protein